MNPQTNMDFSVIDHFRPFKPERVWKTIKYSEEYPAHEFSGFFHERAMVNSAASVLIDASLPGNVAFVSSGTSSDINVELPEKPLWINDKTNKIIILNQRIRFPQEVTWAVCVEAELPEETRFNQAFQKIGRFAGLPENWDSYGAKAIDRECMSRVVSIFKELVKSRSVAEVQIPTPFIAPLSSGGIQIEWEEGERYLEVSVTPDPLSVGFFATDKAKEGQLTYEGSLRSTSALRELLTWFVIGTAESLAQLSFEEPPEEWAF